MNIENDLLRTLAAKYVWWTSPGEALQIPSRIVAHVMNIGDYDDVQSLATALGEDYLRSVVMSAEAGQFNERSWTYWHYRLGIAPLGKVPPMPIRKLA